MQQRWQDTLIDPDAPILEAIRLIDSSERKFAVVVDGDRKLLGVATDGDVRRGILRGVALDAAVSRIMNQRPYIAPMNASPGFLTSFMRAHGIRQLPVVDAEDRVVGVEVLDPGFAQQVDVPVLLMAGGFGRRLGALTERCPKPLLQIGGRPLLETILIEMAAQGFRRFSLAIHYRGEQIRDYFGDGRSLGVEIDYIEEEDELGTAGAVGLLRSAPSDPLVVVNGDVLTKLNFHHLLQFHSDHRAVATMCVSEHTTRVPYGVVHVRDRNLHSIEEKPAQRHLVNAGIYVLSAEARREVPGGRRLDMTELFASLLAQERSAVVFPIREYWMDVGRLDDLERAREEFSEVFSAVSRRESPAPTPAGPVSPAA